MHILLWLRGCRNLWNQLTLQLEMVKNDLVETKRQQEIRWLKEITCRSSSILCEGIEKWKALYSSVLFKWDGIKIANGWLTHLK